MTRFFALFLTIFIFCGVLFQNVSHAADLSVNSLRIGSHPEKTRIVVELSRKADFRVFLLHNPARLVIDLPSFDWRAKMPQADNGNLVGGIRNGILQPGISRIVIDLKTNVNLKSAFFLPAGPNIPDRVVIDVAQAKGPYNPAAERMFGNLSAQSATAAPQTQPVHVLTPPQKPVQETPPPPAPAPSKGPKPMIVIDAGHGGNDPGAVSHGGAKEKTVTLAAAQELKKQLEATGRYRVHLTRSSDTFIKLQDRVKIGRSKEADLFISLHADSIDKPGVSGASIYTLSNTASDAQTAKLAARENQADLIAGVDLSHEDKQVANILIDLAMRDTMNQSKFFANTVVRQANARGIKLLEKPHRYAGFAVLKAPDVPSVLLEMGFMSNKKESSQLASPEYRKKLMSAVVSGIDAYFAKIQKNGQD